MSKTTRKKRKKTKKAGLFLQRSTPNPTRRSTPNPSLPDELILICVARVSRWYYPTLSFVSRSFRSLIASPELYKLRSLLGYTESCVYVRLDRSHPPASSTWYTLCWKPDLPLTRKTYKKNNKDKSSGYVLVKVIPSSPDADALATSILHSPRDARFSGLDIGVSFSSCCMIDNVPYYYAFEGAIFGVLKWYDTEARMSRDVKGLVGLLEYIPSTGVRLVDYGGKMAILWTSISFNRGCNKNMNMISCAVIALERRKNHEMWGKVEWFDHNDIKEVITATL